MKDSFVGCCFVAVFALLLFQFGSFWVQARDNQIKLEQTERTLLLQR